MKRIENADMSEYTSFRAGGRADLLLIPDTEDERREALSEADDLLVLGNGSDTLVKDGGFRGTVIKPGEGFSEITVDGEKFREAIREAYRKNGKKINDIIYDKKEGEFIKDLTYDNNGNIITTKISDKNGHVYSTIKNHIPQQ